MYCRGVGTIAGMTGAGTAAWSSATRTGSRTSTGTATADDVDDSWAVDADGEVKDGTLDDVEEDLKVDVGVTVTGGAGLLGPGARSAMTPWRRRRSAIRSRTDAVLAEGAGLAMLATTRWRRSAIRSRTDALLTEGAMAARDLCWC